MYCQNICGPEHPQFGHGRNAWLTGTAAWTYFAGTQHILGIAPTYAGLRVNPCLPNQWDGFQATRRFRNSVYRIEVHNPSHVCQGIKSVKVDGQAIEGDIVPIFGDGQTHLVEVIMG